MSYWYVSLCVCFLLQKKKKYNQTRIALDDPAAPKKDKSIPLHLTGSRKTHNVYFWKTNANISLCVWISKYILADITDMSVRVLQWAYSLNQEDRTPPKRGLLGKFIDM